MTSHPLCHISWTSTPSSDNWYFTNTVDNLIFTNRDVEKAHFLILLAVLGLLIPSESRICMHGLRGSERNSVYIIIIHVIPLQKGWFDKLLFLKKASHIVYISSNAIETLTAYFEIVTELNVVHQQLMKNFVQFQSPRSRDRNISMFFMSC